MITSLRIASFKAAISVAVPLGPITVLIGPNDSGKSTILQALMAVSRAADKARLSTEQILGCPSRLATTNLDAQKLITFAVEGQAAIGGSQQHSYRYQLSVSPSGRITDESLYFDDKYYLTMTMTNGRVELTSGAQTLNKSSEPHSALSELSGESHLNVSPKTRAVIQAVADDLTATLLRLDSRAIAKPSPLGAALLDDGSGLVGVVDDLLTSGVGDDKIARANEVIRNLSPHVKGVAAKLHPSGGKELHFALRSGAVVPASQVSDGVVLAAALVLISHGMGPKRLLIEEPENGLHPRQLRIVADTIRAIATEHGTQVVLTTHSPLLLNYFGAEETLLVTRNESGVSVRPMDKTKGFDELASEMSLGELWYNVGDSALARPA